MSKASCCCGLSASATAGFDVNGRIETEAAKKAIQKHRRDVRPFRQISLSILFSKSCRQPGDEFRQVIRSLARCRAAHLRASAIPLAVVPAKAWRKPGPITTNARGRIVDAR